MIDGCSRSGASLWTSVRFPLRRTSAPDGLSCGGVAVQGWTRRSLNYSRRHVARIIRQRDKADQQEQRQQRREEGRRKKGEEEAMIARIKRGREAEGTRQSVYELCKTRAVCCHPRLLLASSCALDMQEVGPATLVSRHLILIH